jgi:hypothetical protein
MANTDSPSQPPAPGAPDDPVTQLPRFIDEETVAGAFDKEGNLIRADNTGDSGGGCFVYWLIAIAFMAAIGLGLGAFKILSASSTHNTTPTSSVYEAQSSAGLDPDPCALGAHPDFDTIIGDRLTALPEASPRPNTGADPGGVGGIERQCRFQGTRPGSYGSPQVALEVKLLEPAPGDTQWHAATAFDAERAVLGPPTHDVPRLGQQAYFARDTLVVLQHGRVLEVYVLGGNEPREKRIAVNIINWAH